MFISFYSPITILFIHFILRVATNTNTPNTNMLGMFVRLHHETTVRSGGGLRLSYIGTIPDPSLILPFCPAAMPLSVTSSLRSQSSFASLTWWHIYFYALRQSCELRLTPLFSSHCCLKRVRRSQSESWSSLRWQASFHSLTRTA